REQPLPDDPGERATVAALQARHHRAEIIDALGDTVTSEAMFEEVRAGAEAIDYRPLQSLALERLARRQAVTPKTRDMLYEALHLAESVGYDEGVLTAWSTLIRVHPYLGEYDAATRAARHAEAIAEKLGNDPMRIAAIAEGRGMVHLEKGELDLAIRELSRAVALVEAADPASPNIGVYLGNLGNAYALNENNEEASEVFERAYALHLDALGPMNRAIGHDLMNLGRMSARANRYDESNEYYLQALEVMRTVAPPSDFLTITILNNLGQNYGDQGHHAEAIATVQQAIGDMERAVGPEHRQLVRMRRGLAEIYLDARDFPRALAEGQLALDVSIASFGDDHPETSACRRRMGRILIAADRSTEAVSLLERAFADEHAKNVPPLQHALTSYWLAAALQSDPTARERARELAVAALPALREGELRDQERAKEIEHWLAGTGILGGQDR
ncbi:MAG TPA: tetratricopeptide repeat protein, partial [Nannocystaceae bacterium]|nr:tetratricopeptide repeat protein [Nannocystaceae bacterium]